MRSSTSLWSLCLVFSREAHLEFTASICSSASWRRWASFFLFYKGMICLLVEILKLQISLIFFFLFLYNKNEQFHVFKYSDWQMKAVMQNNQKGLPPNLILNNLCWQLKTFYMQVVLNKQWFECYPLGFLKLLCALDSISFVLGSPLSHLTVGLGHSTLQLSLGLLLLLKLLPQQITVMACWLQSMGKSILGLV